MDGTAGHAPGFAFMKRNKRDAANANNFPRREHATPDRGKCAEQKSRDLHGKAPGDRGMCEKQSTTQGSE